MNNALNEQAIEKYLATIGRFISQNFLYVYMMPSNLDIALLGGFSFVNMQGFIIAFYKNDVLLIPLTKMGDFDITRKPIVIDRSSIYKIKVKKGIMQYTITILTSKGNLKLNCSKKIISKSWQSNNLKFLEANNWII